MSMRNAKRLTANEAWPGYFATTSFKMGSYCSTDLIMINLRAVLNKDCDRNNTVQVLKPSGGTMAVSSTFLEG